MAEPETITVQTGRCGCCPLYTIFPVPTYCSPAQVMYSTEYNASVQLESGSCISGSWGVNVPTLSGEPPAIQDHDKVRVVQRAGFAVFVASGSVGDVESTAPVTISLNGFPVRWEAVDGNILVMIWRPTVSTDATEDLFFVRTDPPPTGGLNDETPARTCITTQFIPDYTVVDVGRGPLQAFMTLRRIETAPFINDFVLPQGAIVFTRYYELMQLAAADAAFRSSAFVPITWQLNIA